MNKQAAEKIAQEYYQIGQALALEASGLTKEANIKNQLMKALGITAAGTAGLGAMHNAPEIAELFGHIQNMAGGLVGNAVSSAIPGKLHGISESIVNAPGNLASLIGNKAGGAAEYLENLIANNMQFG